MNSDRIQCPHIDAQLNETLASMSIRWNPNETVPAGKVCLQRTPVGNGDESWFSFVVPAALLTQSASLPSIVDSIYNAGVRAGRAEAAAALRRLLHLDDEAR